MGRDDGIYYTLILMQAALTNKLKETRHVGRDVICVIKIKVKQKLDFKREFEKKGLRKKVTSSNVT